MPEKTRYIYEKYEHFGANTTLMYRPPEMHDRYLKYNVGFKSDMWMLGCIIYVLCFAQHPFQDVSSLAIINGQYQIPDDEHISDNMRKLIKVLLSVNPEERPNIRQVV